MVVVVVAQDALRVAVRILVLTGAEGPEEPPQPREAEQERHRDEDGENVQLSLSAFSETQIDDADMASAAMIGVACPASARGMATAL